MKNKTKNKLLHKLYIFTLLSTGVTLINLNHSWATKRGAEEDQENILDNDASINPKKRKVSTSSPELALQMNENGDTALHIAAEHGQVDTIEKLLQLHPELALLPTKNGLTALHTAARYGKVNAIEKLLLLQPELALLPSKSGNSPLHTAARYGQVLAIEKLLEIRPELALQPDKNGNSPLHTAAWKGQVQAIEKLLEIRPELALRADKKGNTPLHTAAMHDQVATIEKLLQLQPELALQTSTNGDTALHLAAMYGQVDAIEKLLEIQPELALKISENGTALHVAAMRGEIPTIEKLLQIRPELALQTNKNGVTALHAAVWMDQVASIEKLLQLAPQLLNQQCFSGKSALHIAYKAKETVFPLIKAGIDPTLLDDELRSAASYPNPNVNLIYAYTLLYSVQPNHGIEKARDILNEEKPNVSPEEFAVLEEFVNKKANDFYYTPKRQQRAKQIILNKECATCCKPAQISKSEFRSPGGNGCNCYLCPECAGKLLQTQREEGVNVELKCPSCSLELDDEFIKNTF